MGRGVSFHDLCVSPNITGLVMISKRMRWVGLCQLTGRREMLARFWGRNLKERYNLEDLDIDGRIIEKYMLMYDEMV